MPLFITQGRFTREYIKGGMAKPEDRHAVGAERQEGVWHRRSGRAKRGSV
jgi:hypothetical protein